MSRPTKDKPARRRRLVRYPELKTEFGIPWSRMHVDRQEKAGRFPKRVHIGANTVAWFADEIAEMLEAAGAERGTAA